MIKSYWGIVWEEFQEHKAAITGLIVVVGFILIGILASVISHLSGINPNKQNPLQRYQPPLSYTELSSHDREFLIDEWNRLYPEQFKKISENLFQLNSQFYSNIEDNPYIFISQSYDKIIQDYQQLDNHSQKILQPLIKKIKVFHVLGTDELGRDVLMRLIFGTRVSLGVALLVAVTSSLIGLIIGSLAGYFGGWIDHILMRITDALLSLPLMPVLIVISAINFENLPGFSYFSTLGLESIIKLVFILVLFSWMTVARLVRAEVLSLREREFILASKTLGASSFFIITRHIFPNVLAPLLVAVTLGIGESIQFEAALSFLGLGIQQPTPSWGNMLFNAQEFINEAPFLALVPGILILIVTISFNYIGDGLQEALNPRSIKR